MAFVLETSESSSYHLMPLLLPDIKRVTPFFPERGESNALQQFFLHTYSLYLAVTY